MGRIIPGGAEPLPATADVVVIGGGIAGVTGAFFLGRHGLSAVVLERATQLGSLTTAQAVACFRAQWDEADHAALVLPSIDFYEAFGPEAGRRLAAIVAGVAPDDATNPYRLDRPGLAAGAPRAATY